MHISRPFLQRYQRLASAQFWQVAVGWPILEARILLDAPLNQSNSFTLLVWLSGCQVSASSTHKNPSLHLSIHSGKHEPSGKLISPTRWRWRKLKPQSLFVPALHALFPLHEQKQKAAHILLEQFATIIQTTSAKVKINRIKRLFVSSSVWCLASPTRVFWVNSPWFRESGEWISTGIA